MRLRFAAQPVAAAAEVTISADGQALGKVRFPVAVLMPAGGGETLDIGRDIGVPVTDYRTPHGAIEGDVRHVVIELD